MNKQIFSTLRMEIFFALLIKKSRCDANLLDDMQIQQSCVNLAQKIVCGPNLVDISF